MISNPKSLIDDYIHERQLSGMSISKKEINHQYLPAPHKPSNLPTGKQAVYIFSFPLPSALVLKIGKVGPKSNARFLSQHYNPKSSRSNLATSLLNNPKVWKLQGIQPPNESNVGAWIKRYVDRDNFLIPSSKDKLLLSLFEIFLQCRLQPYFEG